MIHIGLKRWVLTVIMAVLNLNNLLLLSKKDQAFKAPRKD